MFVSLKSLYLVIMRYNHATTRQTTRGSKDGDNNQNPANRSEQNAARVRVILRRRRVEGVLVNSVLHDPFA